MTNNVRVVPLEGGYNFRDLGGYQGFGGKTVKYHQIYRSGKLSDLTDVDRQTLRDLNIRSAIDFRRLSERTDEPSAWHEEHILDVVSFPHHLDGMEGVPRVMGQLIDQEKPAYQVMMDIYWDMPQDHAAHYTETFSRLKDDEKRPLLFHCAGGKDRTGVCAALILHILGVSKEKIYADYLLTNELYPADLRLNRIAKNIAETYNLQNLDPECFRPVVEVNTDYMDNAFKRIETEYGSIEDYLANALDVTADDIEHLREVLLD